MFTFGSPNSPAQEEVIRVRHEIHAMKRDSERLEDGPIIQDLRAVYWQPDPKEVQIMVPINSRDYAAWYIRRDWLPTLIQRNPIHP